MSDFIKKFIEEAREFIAQIETSLLSLEENPKNANLIDEIFRYMHSLKGSGGMFGFDNISSFTHHLETLFDEVRSGNLALNNQIIEITYQSVDLLKQMLTEEDNEQTKQQAKNISQQITQILDFETNKTIHTPQTTELKAIEKDVIPNSSFPTYHIFFEPEEHIFDVGTNPLYLLDELHQLGKAIVVPHFDKVPTIKNMDFNKCYVSWDIFLSTDEEVEVIKDVFLFVEDDCKLIIKALSQVDLTSNASFEKLLDKNIFKQSPIDHDVLLEQIKNLEQDNVTEVIEEDIQPNLTEEFSDEPKEIALEKKVNKENHVSSIRVDSNKIDNFLNLVSELITTQSRLQLNAELSQNADLIAIAEDVEKISRQLRENAFEMSLIPIHNLTTRFKRMVRDLGKELKKDVVFESEGTETELDKSIIEQLADPIMHILRNAIDHGIEDKDTRLSKGKSAQGIIKLKAFYSGTYVHISIEDDGKGIDTDKLRKTGIEKGLLSNEVNYSQQELFEVLFMPGFSTSTEISDISGRGVGMDVVKQSIEDLRGEVSVNSKLGEGSKITLKIPLTLSIIDGLLVSVGITKYIIPLSSIDKIYETSSQHIEKAYNNILVFENQQIQFLNLNQEFEDPADNKNSKYIIVVAYENKRVGLTIDNILGEYQTVLKPLGRYLKSYDIFSGASVLGDGKVALVMDTNKVVNKFSN